MRGSFLAAAALLALSVPGLAQIEGVAEFKGATGEGGGKTIPGAGRVYLGKDAYRMEWAVERPEAARKGAGPAATSRMIIIQKLSDPDHIVNIDDARKLYSVTDLKTFRESSPEIPRETYRVIKQGRDTVGGFPCEKALVTSSGGTRTEICVASEIFPSSAFLALQSRRDRSNNLIKALRANGLEGLPIRLVMRGKGNTQPVSTMELARFEKKPVPPSLFEVPPGYKRASDTPETMAPEIGKAAPRSRKPPAGKKER